jgi:hypothetical protein
MPAATTVAPELKRVFQKMREASDRWADACDEATGLAREGDGAPEEIAEAMMHLEPGVGLHALRRTWAQVALMGTTWTVPEGFDARVIFSFDDEATYFADALQFGPFEVRDGGSCVLDEDVAQELLEGEPSVLVDLFLSVFEPSDLGAPSEPEALSAWREALDEAGVAALLARVRDDTPRPRAEVSHVVETVLTMLIDGGTEVEDLREGYIEDLRAGF